MTDSVAILRRYEMPDFYLYEIADSEHQRHVVEIPIDLLTIEPEEFARGNDQHHLDTLACGAVLMNLTPDAIFHRVDREMVGRAYRAVSRMIPRM